MSIHAWSDGDDAALHDVYFGADEEAVRAADVNSAQLFQARRSETSMLLTEPLEPGQYFWRIDEVASDGQTIHRGPV